MLPHSKTTRVLAIGASLLLAASAAAAPPRGERVGKRWRKHVINAEAPYEAAGVADFDGDGKLDIFSGDSWYQAPRWTRHKVRDIQRSANPHYHEDFGNLPLDVNADGRVDLVTCTFFGQRLGWVENPPDPKLPWIEHEIDRPGASEACRLVDVNGDGRLDLLPATNNVIVWYELAAQRPAVVWKKHEVSRQGAGHGVGIGDLDGDGRLDLIGPHGFYTQPAAGGAWNFRPEFELGAAGILVLGGDLDGDKLGDVVWGMGHDFGLYWLKQVRAGDGKPAWSRYDIDRTLSQLHTLLWVDLDGNGQPALVTGKRVYAHEVEPGATDRPGLYAFRFDRKTGVWRKEVIYEGRAAENAPADARARDAQKDFPRGTAGTGLDVATADIDGDGDLDLVCPGKSGLYLFENLRVRRRR